jgi:signal transduction histidine kinase
MPNAWKDANLSLKIAVMTVLIVLATVAALSLVFITSQSSILRSNLERESGYLLDTLGYAADNDLVVRDIASLANIATQLSDTDDVDSIRFYDGEGRLVVDTTLDEPQLFAIDPDPVGLTLIASTQRLTDWRVTSYEASQPIMIGSRVVGAVSITRDTTLLQTRVYEVALQGLATGLVAIGIAIFFAVVISRSITHPLRDLSKAASEIAQGNYKRSAIVTSQDEVGMLARAFNNMATDIQKRQSDLEQLNQSLEQRVAERTEDMKKARDEAIVAQSIANENSRLKSEFLATMSHELRTPLNAIEGFVGIMLTRMAGVEYNDKTERYLGKVSSNSRRLLGLINDFLDLSRIESGRLELAHMAMNPQEMGRKWHDNLISLADNKGLDFSVVVDPDLPSPIFGDEESITKIAINLVGNAIKFTETGSIRLTLDKHDDTMEMVVSDTGIGIPAHAREFIFEEFRQVDQSSRRQYGGTGLGLAIVQKLARAMGGTVSVQSEVGVGSTFTVRLPIQTEPQEQPI